MPSAVGARRRLGGCVGGWGRSASPPGVFPILIVTVHHRASFDLWRASMRDESRGYAREG
jgi:hypothetical protein